jgi:hypothetical protein
MAESNIAYRLPDMTEIQLLTFKDPLSGKNMVCCDLCRTSITVTPDGSLRYFASHRGSNKCIHAQQNLQQQINQEEIQQMLTGQNSGPSSELFYKSVVLLSLSMC